MTAQRDLDRLLRDHFGSHADRAVLDGQLDAIVDRTAGLGQRPGWLARLRSTSMSATSAVARPAMPRLAWVAVVLGLLILVAIAALVIGGARLTKPAPFNGMISFGRMDAAQGDTVPYVINPDGSHERQLRPETHEATFWSPNGDKVGFTGGHVNADGSDYQEYGDPHQPLYVPCWDWSPDGKTCLAEGWDETNPTRDGLYLVSALDRSNAVQLTHHRDVPGVFSRAGSMVAFLRDDRLFVINVDGTGERPVGGLSVDDGQMSWAVDDAAILVQSAARLYRVDVATGQPTPIRIAGEPEADLWSGIYSPDGTRILFRRPEGANGDLFTMRTDGTDVVRLTTTAADERFIDWGTHPLDQ
jgi:Tol biopolymer transport system component